MKRAQGPGRPAWGASSTLLRAPRFVERSVTVAAVLATTGVAVVAMGANLRGTTGIVVTSIGTILVTVALLSVLYDAYLKDVLLGEVYSALAIEQNVRAVDLKEVIRKDQLDVAFALADARALTAIPLDPETWSRTDWQHVLEHAVKQALEVTIWLPDHDSPHIDVLARRLGVEQEELVSQIHRLPDQLGNSWDEKAPDGGSTLSVNLYSGVPAVGILVTNRMTIIEIPPVLTHAATDRSTLAAVFGRNGTSVLVSDFVDEQLSQGRIPDFSQSVMRPIGRSISPDPPNPSP